MESNFRVNVNDTFDFEFVEKDILQINAIEKTVSKYHVLHNNRSFDVEICSSDFYSKTYTVKINSKRYHIKISNELDVLISKLGLTSGASKEINNVKAPMHGHILDILINTGEKVKEGDSLLILEAMKMENILLAPKEGTVKSINISKGDTVEKGQLLIEME